MTVFVPQVSVVIPVFNEEAGLGVLFDRLYPALDRLGVCIDDHDRMSVRRGDLRDAAPHRARADHTDWGAPLQPHRYRPMYVGARFC